MKLAMLLATVDAAIVCRRSKKSKRQSSVAFPHMSTQQEEVVEGWEDAGEVDEVGAV